MSEVLEKEMFRRAFTRERKARILAENLLESRSNTLYQINERLALEYQRTARRTVEVEFQNSISSLMAGKQKTLDQTLEGFLNLVCNLNIWSLAHVYKPQKNNGEVAFISTDIWYTTAPQSFDWSFVKEHSNELSLHASAIGKVYLEKRSIFISNLAKDSSFTRKEILKKHPFQAWLGVPITIEGETVAVAEFFTAEMGNQDPAIIQMVDLGAEQLSEILGRWKISEELKINYEKLKKTQLQLAQSEKMASIGTIAAGVAHEINNPISFIMSNTETLASYHDVFLKIIDLYAQLNPAQLVEKNTNAEKILQQIEEIKTTEKLDFLVKDSKQLVRESIDGISRIREIVIGLKTFSRTDEVEMKSADVNECIESTLKVLVSELKYKCEIKKDLKKIPEIFCHPGQLIQVFTNILMNAAQAIPEKGTIAIGSDSDADYVRIRIADTGSGISQENLKNIFTPFFTTKPVGKGTGLGLSISYGIIQQHGGDITVESTLGKGTMFTIKLPVKEWKNEDGKK